ncbi:MAG: tetratricopeptide repeat protein [Bacteroidia bacterium]|nr:tetratricopeptide repeat protein [Bacteroidia bacterium]
MKSKELQVPEYEAARGILATPSLVLFDSKTIAAKDNFVRNRSESKAADIHFVINQADIRNSEVTADDMKTFNEYIENLKKDPKRKITGMDISSYASPDGVEDLNTKLAGKRSESTVKKMKDEIKKAPKTKKGEPKIEYKPTDDEILALLKATSTPEDWEGFQKLMQESEIEDKRIILDVLKMHSDPEVREKEIKKLAKVYLVLADKILPKLRRSQMNLAVEITGFTDEELKYLAQNKPDTLNAEELFFAATLFNDIIQKLKIYQTYCGVYPKDWRGPNNVGYCYFQQGKFSDAKKAFEDARAIDSKNTMILNNLGAVAIREGEFDKAIEYLESAAGAGKEVSYNLGIISIKKAGFKTPENDYNEAAGYFGSDCSFNAALAKLLAGNIDNVIKTIDCAENKDDALMYYLKAIVAARQENTDLMLNSLRTAIEKDASLSRKAKTDIEFLKYFDESTFKSIVQ